MSGKSDVPCCATAASADDDDDAPAEDAARKEGEGKSSAEARNLQNRAMAARQVTRPFQQTSAEYRGMGALPELHDGHSPGC